MRQVKEVIDLSCTDESLKFELMQNCMIHMADNFNKDSQPNKIATEVNQYVKQKTKCEDAYFKQKEISNEIALSMLPNVNEILKRDNSLETYVKLAIVGNILDFGGLIRDNLNKSLSINDIEEFEDCLKNNNKALYLVDNSGEIVFDRLLIEKIMEYGVEVIVGVKSSPIVNDACEKEAIDAGLDELAEIVTLG